jgi:alkyldihydroxyacetonephosphate synthase
VAPARGLARDLRRIVGARLSITPVDREACSHDAWPRNLIAVARGAPPARLADVVVWPETEAEVAALLRYASRRRVPVVPFGAGSGVCGAAVPVRGGIVLDMKRMKRMTALSANDHWASFQTGTLGQPLEDALSSRGFTLGHFPSSIYCSTLGGWLATRSAGQCSSRYGKIEDMVLGLRAISGAGERLRTDVERQPDLGALLLGSEGTLGVIVEARLRIRPAPEARLMRGYRFRDVASGCAAMRRVMQLGLRPAVLRLYDPLDTLLQSSGHGHGFRRLGALLGPGARARAASILVGGAAGIGRALHLAVGRAGCLLVAGFEGPSERAAAEAALGHAELSAAGGKDLGCEPGERWLAHRYDVSYQQSRVFLAGAFVDTMEVATTWDRLTDLYESVRRAIAERAFVMAHLSHAYAEGCSIYFTFVASLLDGERRYDELWSAALSTALRSHGCLSHHHGVGLLKLRWMAEEHGAATRLVRAAKRVLDPAGIMNPGKLVA